jgi:filamentous hemagglutinin family protein
MKNVFFRPWRCIGVGILLLMGGANVLRIHANPTGGTVAQGAATFNSSGSQFTVNQASANAFINWQSFNIGAGETTTFVQPSSTSVVWNQINDVNPSQILGSLNANGYVILQNSSGFYVGGQASITAHGLIMTTASTPALNLSSGGPWSFNTPPPTAKIVNYGQINVAGSGPAFLIASDIENHGTISAPGGKIGLYAGQTVLVSMSPDGRGLSAQATVPQGLVDNNGNLIADAGSIALQAQMVNQNGLIQANSAQAVNGTIELVGGDSVNLGANSVISARGDTVGISPGGSVTIKSGNNFSDHAGSTIDIAGGVQGGNGGQADICAPQMAAIDSSVNGQAVNGFTGGILTIDPANIWLASADSDPAAPSGYSIININSYNGLSQINVQADNNIVLNTTWTLAAQTVSASLNLSAGNNITLNDGSAIQAGNYWTVNLAAGTAYTGTTRPAAGSDGIYLNGSAYLQTANNDINLQAANEVIVGSGGVRTIGGGNIGVTTEFGNVNSGTSTAGYNYYALGNGTVASPYYTPFQLTGSGTSQRINFNQSNLGGIGTAAGGNVTINAGGDVISSPATTVAAGDPGTGAFGTEAGNVIIHAGGSVYGNFVEANGTGTITAGQNIGIGPSPNNPNASEQNVALSLAKGSWSLNAQGDIYLQEVRNPNGVFNNTTTGFSTSKRPSAGNHLFDYDPQASLTLTAGNAVYLTGYELPRPNGAVPLLLPPVVTINAGSGGVILNTPTATDGTSFNDVTLSDPDITLFPSSDQNLQITTTDGGWLSSGNTGGSDATLLMSDSGDLQWFVSNSSIQPFSEDDHASVPVLLNNNDPVTINLTGSQMVNNVPVLASMENVTLQTDKATQINVAGDMIGCSFFGENLQATGPASVTSINVGGQIFNAGSFTSVALDQGLPTLPAADTPPTAPPGASLSSWYLALMLAVDPSKLPTQSLNPSQQLAGFLNAAVAFPGLTLSGYLTYNPNTKTLTAIGPMSSTLLQVLQSPTLTVVRYGPNGTPLLDANGHFVTDTITWVPGGSANASLISSLYADSQQSVPLGPGSGAYVVGGTGQFNVTADSISLGNSEGILSVGNDDQAPLGRDYSFLGPYITSGAGINVMASYLEMPGSTIASLAGGNVTVTCTGEIPNSPLNGNGVGVSMDLGSQELLGFEDQIMNVNNFGLGIYTTGAGDVNVTALGTINVDSSRIATFDGGNINVESLTGDVNAGTGGAGVVPIRYYAPNYSGSGLEPVEFVPANGIVAGTLTASRQIPPGAALLPGNITVTTPQGSIFASEGGISQVAFDEILSAASGYTAITLNAGSGSYVGDIILGNSGVIGVNVVAKATGTITGLIISQQNADISAAQSFAGTVFSGGRTTLSSGGTISGTIVAVGGLNTSGSGNLAATILSSSVNGGAGTLATSSSASSASQSAAGQTSAENQQQVAGNGTGNNDDKQKKKSELARSVGRVTVVLPKSS